MHYFVLHAFYYFYNAYNTRPCVCVPNNNPLKGNLIVVDGHACQLYRHKNSKIYFID